MLKRKNFSWLMILAIQMVALCVIPLPVKAQSTYEEGTALITKTVPLNRFNATTQTELSTDNSRFLAQYGVNVSEFVARNINYQNRESYFNDTLYNMQLTNITTRSGKYRSLIPVVGHAFGDYDFKNLTLVPEKMDVEQRIQAVGRDLGALVGIQATYLALINESGAYHQFMVAFIDGSMLGGPYTGRFLIGLASGVSGFGGIYFLNDFNQSAGFDWVMDYTMNRYGITIEITNYYDHFDTFGPQSWISAYNSTSYGYPAYVYTTANLSAYKVFIDLVGSKQLYTYDKFGWVEFGMDGGSQYNPFMIEGFDSRLIGYSINNTQFPDNTFYPDRFDQAYQLFYEPYMNFETDILTYSQIADPDYISMAYEYIGNRWITGETGETFFPTDQVNHFFTDYSNVKRHILLSGNRLLIAGGGILEYSATYTFKEDEIPANWWSLSPLDVFMDYGAHFHNVYSPGGANDFGFQTSQNLTSWNFECYFAIPNGQTLDIYFDNLQLDNQLQISFSDSGTEILLDGVSKSSTIDDWCDGIWHRLDLTCDPYALVILDVDGWGGPGGTITGYKPFEMRNITFSVSDSAIYLDGIGVVGDLGYTNNQNYDHYNPSTYTIDFENTIFDKRTSGIVYTWSTDHNRYNMSSAYFNYKLTFQIQIDYIRLYLNGTDDWDYIIYDQTTPVPVLTSVWIKRMLNFELWMYPVFDGSDYYLAVDFTFDNNRTVIYTDWLDPLDLSLSSVVNSVFTMNDVEVVKAIVFTSSVKSLLKPVDSLTRLLTFSNKQYLTRKIMDYRFNDQFSFGSDDMIIYIEDPTGGFTREVDNAKSIIPLNLTASQQIIQTNTTQYNNAECLAKISLFNKSVQMYSENGFNVSKSINDSELEDFPVESQLIMGQAYSLISGDGPFSAAWYTAIGNAIGTAVHIVQQAASNPVGTIIAIGMALSTHNYQALLPIEDPPSQKDKDKIGLPYEHGGTLTNIQIGNIQTTLNTPDPNSKEEICKRFQAIVDSLIAVFGGAMLYRKIIDLIRINPAYEVCNMLLDAWDFLNGVDPMSVENVKLSVKVEIHGVFSFEESSITDSWISYIIRYLIPFILPCLFGYMAKIFNRKWVSVGVVLGFLMDGFSGLMDWNYITIFGILGAVACYFYFSRTGFDGADVGADTTGPFSERSTVGGD
jgi:hypothetical protein